MQVFCHAPATLWHARSYLWPVRFELATFRCNSKQFAASLITMCVCVRGPVPVCGNVCACYQQLPVVKFCRGPKNLHNLMSHCAKCCKFKCKCMKIKTNSIPNKTDTLADRGKKGNRNGKQRIERKRGPPVHNADAYCWRECSAFDCSNNCK